MVSNLRVAKPHGLMSALLALICNENTGMSIFYSAPPHPPALGITFCTPHIINCADMKMLIHYNVSKAWYRKRLLPYGGPYLREGSGQLHN